MILWVCKKKIDFNLFFILNSVWETLLEKVKIYKYIVETKYIMNSICFILSYLT